MQELLSRFVAAFARGIEGELAAMRESTETFEIALTRGEELGGPRYSFERGGGDTLAAGTSCLLRTPRGEQRVTIERSDETRVMLIATQPVDVSAAPISLVVAPWFLYDRLLQSLRELDVERHGVGLALRMFGKQPHTRTRATALRCDHRALDASQQAAVQLCRESDLAFVWGPPGTGKTVTLVHVVEEMLANDERVLLASTTNAAIDQILAKLSVRPWFADAVAAGTIVRLGRSTADTYGTELRDVVEREQGANRSALERLRARVGEVVQQLRHASALLAELAPAVETQQSLFAAAPSRLHAGTLGRVFAAGLADTIAELGPSAQQRVIERHVARLERVRVLAKARIAALVAAGRELELRVVDNARLVTCTLATAHLHPALAEQRFDVFIAEEAGMATLPALFYAACLCRERAIVVGDPRQLPPIVQSNDERVRRAIGRNVFDVAIADPGSSAVVAMLQVQYRMHPAIGALVGRLFYDDRLLHAADRATTEEIGARAPFPGEAVVVVDTRGRSRCERSAKGSSRINRESAQITAELALEATRGGMSSIGVITPYAAQAAEIRRLLVGYGIAGAVECNTIHRFQGRECDAILLDLVDAAPMRPSALVTEAPNLLNVSISRARGKLVIVADVSYFRAAAPDGVVARLLQMAPRR